MLVYPAVAADVVCVVAFAVIGRSSHGESVNLSGVIATASPFLAGTLVGLVASRVWRAPAATRTGVVVWLGTVLGGVALRLVGGSTAQPAFVLVAGVTLGLLLVGWRLAYRLVGRVRAS